MATIDLATSGNAIPRRALEEAGKRIVAVAATLKDERPGATGLRQRAAELEGVAHRLRWVADVYAVSREVSS